MWPNSVEEVFFHSDLLGAHEVGGILVRYILIHAGFDCTDAKLRFLPPRYTFPVNSLRRNLKKALKVECWLAWSPFSKLHRLQQDPKQSTVWGGTQWYVGEWGTLDHCPKKTSGTLSVRLYILPVWSMPREVSRML